MTSLLIENALILCDAATPPIENGHVLIEHGRVAAVGPGRYEGIATPTETIDARDKLLAPGLVNAHTHSQSATMAGFGDALSHPAFMWLTQAHTSRRTPDEVRLAVQLTAYAALTSGTTALLDHFPGQRFTGDYLDAVLRAWDETGMRAVLGVRFFDGAFDDIFPAQLDATLKAKLDGVELLKPQPTEELAELMEDCIRRWHGVRRLSVFPAPSNPERCTDAALRLCADVAEKYDTGIHTHLLETKKQADLARTRHGVTAVGHLERLGVLSDRWSCAHSIWLDDSDIARMAERGAVAVLNPESNARIGSGTARIPDLKRAGVRMALGSDGAGANDNLVMHEAMRAVATMHRAGEGDRSRWITAADAFTMATEGGGAALRVPDIGRIAVGYRADLVLYRLDAPWWIPVNDPVNQLVFAETGASVETVIVEGDIVMQDRKIKTFDADALRREVNAMVASLRKRNGDLFAAAKAIAAVVP